MAEQNRRLTAWQLAVSVIVTHLFADYLRRSKKPRQEGQALLGEWLAAARALELVGEEPIDDDTPSFSRLVEERLEEFVREVTVLAECENEPRERTPH